MSLFSRTEVRKPSLDSFKATSAAIDDSAALEKISGGLLSGCHTGGRLRSVGSLSSLGAVQFQTFMV